jgi:hypothetical protein
MYALQLFFYSVKASIDAVEPDINLLVVFLNPVEPMRVVIDGNDMRANAAFQILKITIHSLKITPHANDRTREFAYVFVDAPVPSAFPQALQARCWVVHQPW